MRFFIAFLLLFPVFANATDILLTWDLPTLREDGSTIEQIDNFKLYTSINNVVQTATEINGTSTSNTLENVPPGSYTFQISSVEFGKEGALSDPISVNITEKLIAKTGKILLTIQVIE